MDSQCEVTLSVRPLSFHFSWRKWVSISNITNSQTYVLEYLCSCGLHPDYIFSRSGKYGYPPLFTALHVMICFPNKRRFFSPSIVKTQLVNVTSFLFNSYYMHYINTILKFINTNLLSIVSRFSIRLNTHFWA